MESVIPIFLSEDFRYSYYFQFCIATVIQYWNGENIGKLLTEISLLLAIDFIKVKHSKVYQGLSNANRKLNNITNGCLYIRHSFNNKGYADSALTPAHYLFSMNVSFEIHYYYGGFSFFLFNLSQKLNLLMQEKQIK